MDNAITITFVIICYTTSLFFPYCLEKITLILYHMNQLLTPPYCRGVLSMKKLVVLILMSFAFQSWSQQAEPLIFRERTFDFGEIEEGKGPADHEFTFTNNSGRPVKILSVQASCGCTTQGWSQNPVPQGKNGFIKVSFDPKGRPGYFNKSLTVTTDWDSNPIILQIKGQVMTGAERETGDFTVASGNLYFKTKSFNFGKAFINKDPVVKQFPVMNKGTLPIKFLNVAKPAYVQVEVPVVLAPQEIGAIKVSYDARQKNLFGFASENIQITTDDERQELKSISVFAILEEYYPVPLGEEATRIPILTIKEETIDLGHFRQSATIDRGVMLKNAGKKDLQIKALQGNCACISAEVANKLIRPGDSTLLKISFKPQSRGGTQQKAITLYSNDPRSPVRRINVLAFIED